MDAGEVNRLMDSLTTPDVWSPTAIRILERRDSINRLIETYWFENAARYVYEQHLKNGHFSWDTQVLRNVILGLNAKYDFHRCKWMLCASESGNHVFCHFRHYKVFYAQSQATSGSENVDVILVGLDYHDASDKPGSTITCSAGGRWVAGTYASTYVGPGMSEVENSLHGWDPRRSTSIMTMNDHTFKAVSSASSRVFALPEAQTNPVIGRVFQ